MKEIIILIAEFVNGIHDLLMDITESLGWNLTDKDLHLWVFGIIGIICFAVVHAVFKVISKYSITALSFFYTFTVLLVIVFAIEIQQKVTGRGEMSFDDAIISIWGFLLFFFLFLVLKGIFVYFTSFTKKKNKRSIG
ncbi:hypothetical protein ACVBAX_16295 [Robertmurraya sp. GLU-23]